MTNRELEDLINKGYPTRRNFIQHFNIIVGDKLLHETQLSLQLAGRRDISTGWECAYKLFFGTIEHLWTYTREDVIVTVPAMLAIQLGMPKAQYPYELDKTQWAFLTNETTIRFFSNKK